MTPFLFQCTVTTLFLNTLLNHRIAADNTRKALQNANRDKIFCWVLDWVDCQKTFFCHKMDTDNSKWPKNMIYEKKKL